MSTLCISYTSERNSFVYFFVVHCSISEKGANQDSFSPATARNNCTKPRFVCCACTFKRVTNVEKNFSLLRAIDGVVCYLLRMNIKEENTRRKAYIYVHYTTRIRVTWIPSPNSPKSSIYKYIAHAMCTCVIRVSVFDDESFIYSREREIVYFFLFPSCRSISQVIPFNKVRVHKFYIIYI